MVKAERLEHDDCWIYLAHLTLRVNAVLPTVQAPHIYHMVRVKAGLEPADGGLLEAGDAYLRYEFAIIGLFWSVLWSVGACMFWSRFSIFGICFELRDMPREPCPDFNPEVLEQTC